MDTPPLRSAASAGEALGQLLCIVCITIISVLFGIKIAGDRLKNLNYARILVLLLYFVSWAFTTMSAILLSTNAGNMISCDLSILACDVFYAGSNIIMYLWFIERVWLVTTMRASRMKSLLYKFHMLLLTPYVGIFILMILFRVSHLNADATCTIGLQRPASIPLMVYDFVFNSYLTVLFIRPLTVVSNASQDWPNSHSFLSRISRRTMLASITCLIASTANVLVVALLHGEERDFVCLGLCSLDVTLNVSSVHWVTTSAIQSSQSNKYKFPFSDIERDQNDLKNIDKGSEVYIVADVSYQTTSDVQSAGK